MLLDAAGVPVPLGRSVTSAEEAWEAAQELGGPVVVKPRDGSQGRGVAVNIETRERVIQAFEVAEEISSEVIVERYIPGHDFRLLVVGGNLVAASRRDPPQVTGDGRHTIRQLVEQVNADPLRGDGHATSLTKIRFDDIALATLKKQGYDADSVPPPGTLIFLRNNANLSTGGSATDVTDEVHPEMAARAVSAARMIGLDICGVDIVAESVLYPLEEQHGGVVEVNAAPGLRMHLNPSFGKGRNVGEAIIANMYADGEDGRIPVVAVAGTNGKTTTVRLTAHLLGAAGHRVGMTNSDGVYVDNLRIDTGDCSGPRSARSVLMHPDVDAAVFETARRHPARRPGVRPLQRGHRHQHRHGRPPGPGLHQHGRGPGRGQARHRPARASVGHGGAERRRSHRRRDGRQLPRLDHLFRRGPQPSHHGHASRPGPARGLSRRRQHRRGPRRGGNPLPAGRDPAHPQRHHRLPGRERDGFHRRGLGLNLDWSIVRRGLASFVNDAQTAPGRFNVFDYRGATVIADYGHNPDAILALVRAVDAMPAKRRSVVISGAGDRRDEDIRMQTEILGEAFDDVLLYQDQCQRGRADGEVVALLRQGLVNATRAKQVDEIYGEFLAIDTALARLQAGDLCLILVDQVEEALEHIAKRIRKPDSGPERR